MQLYRLKIKPLSPWCTPWHADTLAGMLCWMMARTQGGDSLQQEIIEPALAGSPPFVVSDLFPAELLPVPIHVRLFDWPSRDRKLVRKARWVTRETFGKLQLGAQPEVAELLTGDGLLHQTQMRNQIDRFAGTTGGGGELFGVRQTYLTQDIRHLTLYARICDEFIDRFRELLRELSLVGFGADSSVGKGQFEVQGDLEPQRELDETEQQDGCVILSHFQPAKSDSTSGYWRTKVKFGKLGPDFGTENVFKRPAVFFEPGAVLRTASDVGVVGRAIPMSELVAGETLQVLQERDIQAAHLAFGLAVPFRWPAALAPLVESPAV